MEETIAEIRITAEDVAACISERRRPQGEAWEEFLDFLRAHLADALLENFPDEVQYMLDAYEDVRSWNR